MADIKAPNIDLLMARAYDRWRANAGAWSMAQFWAQLSPAEEVAVYFGNFNYQVENGGFSQWGPLGNGYGTPEVIASLLGHIGKMPPTDETRVVTGLIKRASSLFEDAAAGTANTDEYDEDDWDEHDGDDNWTSLHRLDGPFYKVNHAFIEQVEAYLLANFKF